MLPRGYPSHPGILSCDRIGIQSASALLHFPALSERDYSLHLLLLPGVDRLKWRLAHFPRHRQTEFPGVIWPLCSILMKNSFYFCLKSLYWWLHLDQEGLYYFWMPLEVDVAIQKLEVRPSHYSDSRTRLRRAARSNHLQCCSWTWSLGRLLPAAWLLRSWACLLQWASSGIRTLCRWNLLQMPISQLLTPSSFPPSLGVAAERPLDWSWCYRLLAQHPLSSGSPNWTLRLVRMFARRWFVSVAATDHSLPIAELGPALFLLPR